MKRIDLEYNITSHALFGKNWNKNYWAIIVYDDIVKDYIRYMS